MLVNLLNTLLLSVGMGAHLSVAPILTIENKQEIKEQRANTNESYEIEPTDTTNQLNVRNTTVNNMSFEYVTYYNRSTGSNFVCSYNIKKMSQTILVRDQRTTPQNNYYITRNNDYDYAPTYSYTKPGVLSCLYIVKIEQTERQYNTFLNIRLECTAEVSNLITQGIHIGYIYTIYKTTEEDLTSYITNTTDQNYYDLTDYTEYILGNNHTISYLSNGNIEATIENQPNIMESINANYNLPLSLDANRTNYFVIPVQLAFWNTNIQGEYYYREFNTTDLPAPSIGAYINNLNGNYVIPGTGGTEVVDIPGLTFEILTMPFTFISIAFNLTLFPGTPYQVNISNLFFILLGIAIFIFLMNLIIKAMSKG